ncbi:MAG TPA: MDR family MFS transporter [Actinocrinis sp.]|nr:MDR family MFS transporter [Actinocrinis sp.]
MSDSIAEAPPALSDNGMTHRQIMVVFSGLMLGLMLAALDQTIVSTALLTIVRDLNPVNGTSQMPWVVTAYLLSSTAVTPIYGKLADLYGPKKIYMFAIGLFLLGSALCGMSQNMSELIGFRALQGLGGGGLMALTFTIIGSVVSPRERGKYQGYFGGVFMLAMVIGPLIGGFFTDQAKLFGVSGWRFIFYVNLPIGLAALVVISIVLHVKGDNRKHKIDYTGAALVVAGACALLLAAQLGSNGQYAWGSSVIISLFVVGAVLVLAFIGWEFKLASEPLLPMPLFRNPVFSVSNAMAFVVGLTMMGSLIYLSYYLQLVVGYSPTKAGLAILPMMAGIMPASIIAGKLITKMGKYRPFPIAGTALSVVGMFLLSRITLQTGALERSIYMFILGVGLGLVMPVLTLAVQNALPFKDIGTGTSANLFFRNMGSSFGTAIFGAILTNRLTHYMAQATQGKPSAGSSSDLSNLTKSQLAALDVKNPGIEYAVLHSFVEAMSVVFATAAVIMAVAFVLSLFLKQVSLRSNGPAAGSSPAQGEDDSEFADIAAAPAMH